jgi:hypothetical protein
MAVKRLCLSGTRGYTPSWTTSCHSDSRRPWTCRILAGGTCLRPTTRFFQRLHPSPKQLVVHLAVDAGLAEQERYHPFCSDFGPVKISVVHRFCEQLRRTIPAQLSEERHCVYTIPEDTRIASNAAFLLAAFLVLDHGFSPTRAATPFAKLQPSPFIMFRDATHTRADFHISIFDCLNGLQRALHLGWFSTVDFDSSLNLYEHWDDPMQGMLPILVPHETVRSSVAAIVLQGKILIATALYHLNRGLTSDQRQVCRVQRPRVGSWACSIRAPTKNVLRRVSHDGRYRSRASER